MENLRPDMHGQYEAHNKNVYNACAKSNSSVIAYEK